MSRKALIIGIGAGFQSLVTSVGINLFMVRILDSQEVFGLFRQVWLVVNTCIPVFQFGVHFSVYYYLPSLAREFSRAFVMRCLFLLMVSGFLLATGLFFAAGAIAHAFGSPALGPLLQAMSLYPLFTVPSILLFHFFISEGRETRAMLYNIVTLALQSSVMVVMAALGVELRTIFLCVSGFSIFRLLHHSRELWRFSTGSWRHPLPIPLRDHLAYALPVGMTATVAIAGQKVDKFIVSGFLDSATFGLYSVGAVEFPAIVLVSLAASLAMRPRLSRLHHRGDKKEIRRFWSSAFRKTTLVLIPMAVYLAVFSREVVEFLYTSAYGDSAAVFRIYLLLTVSRFALLEPVLTSAGRTRIILLGGIGFLVVDLGLNIILVRTVGLLGPPTATVIATTLLVVYHAWNVGRYLGVSPLRFIPFTTVLRVLLIAAGAGLVVLPVRALHWSYLPVLFSGAVLFGTVYLLLGIAVRAVTQEDLSLIRGFLRLPGKGGPA